MSPDNARLNGATGYCLAAADRAHFVFFVEDADSATIDLNGMPGRQPLVLVDARARYDEIDRDSLTAAVHKIALGPTSDWTLAVGQFSPRGP